MSRHVLASCVIVCLLSLPFLSAAVVHHQPETVSPVSPSPEPGSVTIYVDLLRFRAMSVEASLPAFYFEVDINGEPALPGREVHRGADLWLDNLTASRTIVYDPDTPVDIVIRARQRSPLLDTICDISPRSGLLGGRALTLTYDLRTGQWTGDDHLEDGDGYGHASGFADGNERQQDAEIWFDIYQVEEGCPPDRITYWKKVNYYHLDGHQSYQGYDPDQDGIPMEWEDKYGYDPLAWDDHAALDPDRDGLTNLQEYMMEEWLADPFAQDIYVEIDGMEGPFRWSQPYMLPEESQHLLSNVFARHNITLIFDDGLMGEGGELLPYDNLTSYEDMWNARNRYFLHWNHNHPRRGVFHYALICAQIDFSRRPAGGCAFAIDSHIIAGQYVRNWLPSFVAQGSDYHTAFASVFMHELGHTLGLNRFGGIDNEESRFPWNKEYWQWGPYESCMNYRYVYKLVDYSDGDDEDYDQNDWEIIDLTRFAREDW